ncbi:MAG: carbon storage regulator [Planctomycetales bacterium]|nr:carbon storage regulator [Planctomycetales bacterium]MBN8625250.1 carbon storage regulator [Planctomycetota bacterium]
MLVLTRRVGESIRIGDGITVTLVQMAPGKVRIGIEAPPEMTILREELVQKSPATPLPLDSTTPFFSEELSK